MNRSDVRHDVGIQKAMFVCCLNLLAKLGLDVDEIVNEKATQYYSQAIAFGRMLIDAGLFDLIHPAYCFGLQLALRTEREDRLL